jgi:hypothetical protein
MTQTKRNGPGQATRTVSEITNSTAFTVTDRDVSLYARAQAGPPCPGRQLWAVTVLRCPSCLGMHQHRVGQVSMLLSGRVDRRCPTTGELYRLAPVQRRREAVRRV